MNDNELLSKILLGTIGIGDIKDGPEKYCPVIVADYSIERERSVPFGFPGIIYVHEVDDDIMDKNIYVVFPFPSTPNTNIHRGSTCDIYRPFTKERENRSIVDNHVIKNISVLSSGKVKRAIKHARETGPVSFVLDKKSMQKAVSFLSQITEWFKYHSVFSFNSLSVSTATEAIRKRNEQPITVMTFLNIEDCIPIFNSKKVDGIGLLLETVFPKTSIDERAIASVSCLSMVLSNYKENLFVVDGQRIMEPNKIRMDTLETVESIAQLELKGKGKAKKENKKQVSYVTHPFASTGSTTIRLSSDTSTTGNSWY